MSAQRTRRSACRDSGQGLSPRPRAGLARAVAACPHLADAAFARHDRGRWPS